MASSYPFTSIVDVLRVVGVDEDDGRYIWLGRCIVEDWVTSEWFTISYFTLTTESLEFDLDMEERTLEKSFEHRELGFRAAMGSIIGSNKNEQRNENVQNAGYEGYAGPNPWSYEKFFRLWKSQVARLVSPVVSVFGPS
eukprot:GHVH01004136.1.p2 GENE.GHVH01004136.1~~GHVH01004136.1.p2  ORF type:complete len:139 (+),score=19.53 GHVH01004136.1:717-1133(+)